MRVSSAISTFDTVGLGRGGCILWSFRNQWHVWLRPQTSLKFYVFLPSIPSNRAFIKYMGVTIPRPHSWLVQKTIISICIINVSVNMVTSDNLYQSLKWSSSIQTLWFYNLCEITTSKIWKTIIVSSLFIYEQLSSEHIRNIRNTCMHMICLPKAVMVCKRLELNCWLGMSINVLVGQYDLKQIMPLKQPF